MQNQVPTIFTCTYFVHVPVKLANGRWVAGLMYAKVAPLGKDLQFILGGNFIYTHKINLGHFPQPHLTSLDWRLRAKFADLFPADIPPVHTYQFLVRHHIKLDDPATIINLSGYLVAKHFHQAWYNLLKQHLTAGRLRLSCLFYSLPAFIIPKKGYKPNELPVQCHVAPLDMATPPPPVFGNISPSRTREPSSPKSSVDTPFSTAQLALLRTLFTEFATAPSAPAPPSATMPPAAAPEPTHNVAPITSTMVAKTTFPKHSCLDGPKLFTNWVHQLRLCLPMHLCSYILDGVAPTTWTPAQLASCDILVGSIDSTKVLAVLDSIPIADLTAPSVFLALKSRFAPNDATHMLKLLSKLWSFRPMPSMVADFDNWVSELNAIVQEIIDAKTTLNDVMVTHILVITHPSLDGFKFGFMDKQCSHRQLPPMDLILDRVHMQLWIMNLTGNQLAMLASSSTALSRLHCHACKGPH
ncbi:BQ2448_6231 [Microbotryum intermedium]|uniref:BQ2448_6231 protein n=1 Tax=Microbotryum intermedium TaxID=269621 RepID=A0A238FNP3_9BASI|nr:BQ2448_6231 [Microbotryum intermedium]